MGDRGLPARVGLLWRFLIERGERVLRVTTKLMADSRRRDRGCGKSDSIDAIAVARAALREGLDALPAAQLEGPELDLRLLVDHRERLVRQRVALNNTLQWHLHDIWPELQLPGSSLFHGTWGPRVARRLARAEQTMRVRIARDEPRRIRELSQTIEALEAEIAKLVAAVAPQLLTEADLGPLTAAKLVGEIAGASRFATDAKLARAAWALGAVGGNYGRRSVSGPDGLGALCAYRCHVVLGGPDFAIVVGFEGSPRAEDALALGELLAVRGGARLVVVRVYLCRPVVSIESGEQARITVARAGALLGRRCRWEFRAAPAFSIEDGLLDAAAAERAVAIVVGSSRRLRGRRTRGERLVRRSADCAVTIAPLGFRARTAGLLDADTASR